MSLLQSATPDLRQKLLELYQVADLKRAFGTVGATKEEIAAVAAAGNGVSDIAAVTRCVSDYFGCCKQHVYVFDRQAGSPTAIASGDLIESTPQSALFISTLDFQVITQNPLSLKTATYLWPIKVETTGACTVVRLVTLERDVAALYGDTARVIARSATEDSILDAWGLTSDLRIDLNKGVKAIWGSDWIDCVKGRYKKAFALTLESMDAGRGIKAYYKDTYDAMMLTEIKNSFFKLLDPAMPSVRFSSDPSEGKIGFQTYTRQGDSDAIIRRIIAEN